MYWWGGGVPPVWEVFLKNTNFLTPPLIQITRELLEAQKGCLVQKYFGRNSVFFVRCSLVARPVDGDWGSSQAARDLVAHATCNRLRPRKVHQGWTCHVLPPGGHISTTTKKLYHPPAVMTRDQQGIWGVMPWCFWSTLILHLQILVVLIIWMTTACNTVVALKT